jgi:hypothetical protein
MHRSIALETLVGVNTGSSHHVGTNPQYAPRIIVQSTLHLILNYYLQMGRHGIAANTEHTPLTVATSLNVVARSFVRYAERCVYLRLLSLKLIRRLPVCCLRSLISRPAISRLAQRVPGPRARTACRSEPAAPPSDGAACKLMLHIAITYLNTGHGTDAPPTP